MFDFIRKAALWDACDKGYLEELKSKNISYQLKNAQDVAIYRLVREARGMDIAEIGGGDSRILERLAQHNRCTNIEKFEGRDLGPKAPVALQNVCNVNAYVGDFDAQLRDASFDLVFSISVVEHVETPKLDAFLRDSLRILKPGGRFIHAIDIYVAEEATRYMVDRFERYRAWLGMTKLIRPIAAVYSGPLRFTTDMASNPDNILYGWNSLVPALRDVRVRSQNVSLIVGAIKL